MLKSHPFEPGAARARPSENQDSLIPTEWPAADDLTTRGAALRRFLRACRARLRPEEVGIQPCRRRRGDGLRQVDVAELAQVSPRWYEVFERGTLCRRFSASFVARIADVLRLDPRERASLCRLALPEVAETVEYFERLVQERS
jgi:helix-turn-helix protein